VAEIELRQLDERSRLSTSADSIERAAGGIITWTQFLLPDQNQPKKLVGLIIISPTGSSRHSLPVVTMLPVTRRMEFECEFCKLQKNLGLYNHK